MHDKPHVFLIDAHAEGVGRGDDGHLAGNERILDPLLIGRIETGMEVLRVPSPRLQGLRQLLGPFAPARVYDCRPARHCGGRFPDVLCKQLKDTSAFLRSRHLLDRVAQVLPVNPVGRKHLHLLAERFTEMGDNFLAYVELRGSGEARHRRGIDPFPRRELSDEAGRVQVVRAEVVPPFRDAVGLVEHPGGDLTLAYGCCEGTGSQLFGRDIKKREAPEPYSFEHIVARAW